MPETMKMDFFGEGTKFHLCVFYAAIVGLVVGCYFISNRILYRIGTKPVMAIVKKSTESRD
jgi:phosphate/sulfate permease